jgi:hypothetical protein
MLATAFYPAINLLDGTATLEPERVLIYFA